MHRESADILRIYYTDIECRYIENIVYGHRKYRHIENILHILRKCRHIKRLCRHNEIILHRQRVQTYYRHSVQTVSAYISQT